MPRSVVRHAVCFSPMIMVFPFNSRVIGYGTELCAVNIVVSYFVVYFQEQVIKFANYLVTRKHVQSVKDTGALLFALDKLGNNPVSELAQPTYYTCEIFCTQLSSGLNEKPDL